MDPRTGRESREATRFLHDLAASADLETFARLGLDGLPRLVPSDLTTLSVCDLRTGRRYVISSPAHALSAGDIACFDRFFFEHPLVRFHSRQPAAGAHRMSDSLSTREFRRTPLYNEYYRRIGVVHVLALPVHVDRTTLVSFVLNRSGRDFTDAERDLLDVARTWLAATYRNVVALERATETLRMLRRELAARAVVEPSPVPATLTPREREVLRWVGAGKSNVQIAMILGASPRTVQKHLEHVYVKLGVESRLAAVLRVSQSAAQPDGAPRTRRSAAAPARQRR